MLKKSDIKIYGGGKTWASQTLKDLRDNHGLNIISRWLDLPHSLTGPEDEFSEEVHNNHKLLGDIWDLGCKADCLMADMGLFLTWPYDENNHSGSLVEIGHITVFDKPVYILGSCQSFEPIGNSDRAFMYQKCFHYWPEYQDDMITGANKAIEHYLKHYAPSQWIKNRSDMAFAKLYSKAC